jgi:hypothetical protein
VRSLPHIFLFGFRPAFGAWSVCTLLLGTIMVSAPTAAAQNDVDALLGQARVAEKAGDYSGATRV